MDAEPSGVRVLYGAAAIAQYLNKLGLPTTKRSVFHWLQRGHLKGVVRIGNIYVITEENLLRNFEPTPGNPEQ
jgi:hypothetical protein